MRLKPISRASRAAPKTTAARPPALQGKHGEIGQHPGGDQRHHRVPARKAVAGLEQQWIDEGGSRASEELFEQLVEGFTSNQSRNPHPNIKPSSSQAVDHGDEQAQRPENLERTQARDEQE